MDNAAYQAYFAGIIAVFKGFTVTVHEVVESKEEKKIMMLASSVAETPIGPYHNVCSSPYFRTHKYISLQLDRVFPLKDFPSDRPIRFGNCWLTDCGNV